MYSFYLMPVRDRTDLRRRLAQLARQQSGYFTAAQARAVGHSYASQRYHVERGNWVRVDRGMFRLRDWPVGEHEDLVRWSLWAGPDAVVSHDTALSFYDLGDANPARVHLTVPKGFRRSAPGIELHSGTIGPSDVRHGEGFSVTTPIRALLDAAASDMDADQLGTAIADAARRGLVSASALRSRADGHGPRAALRIERALAA